MQMERLLSKLQAGVDRFSEVPTSVASQFEAQTEVSVLAVVACLAGVVGVSGCLFLFARTVLPLLFK